MIPRLAAALTLAATATVTGQSTRPPLDELVRDLQAKYESVGDFSADFEHRYQGGLIRTSVVERGTVVIEKPGKMRWHYVAPEDKLYVSDGETFYSYYPADRQVVVTAVPPDDRASTPVLFLAGKGNLADDFSASYEEAPDRPGVWRLRLTPTVPDADYESLVLTVDRSTLSITGLSTIDLQGGESTYTFTNLEENTDPAPGRFTFEIPEGVDVIRDDGA